METVKLFQLGNSQAVRLPQAFCMPGDEVKIYRVGSRIILEPLITSWDDLLLALDELPDGFLESRRE